MRPNEKSSRAGSRLQRDEQGHSWLEFALVVLLMCVVLLLLVMAMTPTM